MIADSGILPTTDTCDVRVPAVRPAEPAFFTEVGQADRYAREMTDWLRSQPDPAVCLDLNLIHATMNEQNLRPMMEARGWLITKFLRQYGAPLEHSFPARTRKHLRVGILVNHLCPGAELRSAAAIAKNLPAEFEVRVYSPHDGPLKGFLQAHVLPSAGPDAVRVLREADLDIALFAGNSSMVTNTLTYLSAHKIARVQVAGMWSLTTTGMQHNDVYLTGAMGDAPEQYTERLVPMKGSAHCFAGLPGDQAPRLRTRPAGKIRYVSAASFYKITPECLDAWAAILREVPGSELMLYPFGPNWAATYPVQEWVNFVAAFMAERGVDAERVLIWNGKLADIPEGSRLEDGDIYLDSLPVSGATGLIEPLQAGLPVVTGKGKTMRSSLGWYMLHRSDCAVGLPYHGYAVQLGQDDEYRTWVKRELWNAAQAGFLDTQAQGRNVGQTLTELWHSRN